MRNNNAGSAWFCCALLQSGLVYRWVQDANTTWTIVGTVFVCWYLVLAAAHWLGGRDEH
jgi:Flp pilus assembly protein protease CpaA